MNYKFKKYFRKTGLNKEWGSLLLSLIIDKKPKHFLEIGVFCGVTSRNVCELLNTIHKGNFLYTGFDLFGEKLNQERNEIVPEYIKNQKFSNLLKHFYYNVILKENLNSVEIDFAFIDGGHSYKTTYSDLSVLYSSMKNKRKTIVCDDYMDASYITEVKAAVDDFVKKNNLKLEVIKSKFALIET